MKRGCDQMEQSESNMVSDVSENEQISKKVRESNTVECSDQIMEVEDKPSCSLSNPMPYNPLFGYGIPTLVERENHPGGYSLISPEYVGKKNHNDIPELQANLSSAANYTEWNAKNKLNMIGQQMKFLHYQFQKVINETTRDAELHSAACNFIKKPGNTYHLYERLSGQKYFSMLSPQDWDGNSPHKFLGSWYLESDQSWIPADKVHLKHSGFEFLKEFYGDKKYSISYS